MKLGFWTLYDVEWTNEEIAQRAAALGYKGVDLRVVVPGVKLGVGVNLNEDFTLVRHSCQPSAFSHQPKTATHQPFTHFR